MRTSDENLLEGVDQVPDGADALQAVVDIAVGLVLLVIGILGFVGSLFSNSRRRHRA